MDKTHPEYVQILQFRLPWFDPAGEISYSAMQLSAPGGLCKRKFKRIARAWYKENIGRTVTNDTLTRIWQYRFETRALTEDELRQQAHEMATRLHEEIEESTNTGVQANPSEDTGE